MKRTNADAKGAGDTSLEERIAETVIAATRQLRDRRSEVFRLPRVGRTNWVKIGDIRISIAFDLRDAPGRELIDVFDERRKVFSAWTDPIELVRLDPGRWLSTVLDSAGVEVDTFVAEWNRRTMPDGMEESL